MLLPSGKKGTEKENQGLINVNEVIYLRYSEIEEITEELTPLRS